MRPQCGYRSLHPAACQFGASESYVPVMSTYGSLSAREGAYEVPVGNSLILPTDAMGFIVMTKRATRLT